MSCFSSSGCGPSAATHILSQRRTWQVVLQCFRLLLAEVRLLNWKTYQMYHIIPSAKCSMVGCATPTTWVRNPKNLLMEW
jgi:hypothetical protein